MDFLYDKYKRRAIFAIMSALVAILLVINAVTYSISKQVIEHQFGLSAQSMAVAVSLLIGEDLDAYRNFLDTRDVNSEYYRQMQVRFAKIKKTSNIRFVYTMKQLDDNRMEFILDGEPIGSDDYSKPGDTEDITDAVRQLLLTKQPTIQEPATSDFGVLLCGNAPIIDEDGGLLGIAAVDIDNSMVFSTIRHLFIILVIVCLLLLILIYFLLSRVAPYFLGALLKDKLTNAYNKRYFDSLLKKSINMALKNKYDLSLLMLDLDHFKNVNDTYGHPFGDVVLAKVSGLIRECLRKDDFFVRYGGEEFCILLSNVNNAVAVMLAERIRKAVESFEIYNEEKDMGINITISIGVANLNKTKLSAAELLRNSDSALYKAKVTRNAVAVFSG
jgi:diguanylate cyclase (GGDEF)-like protein